GEVELGCARRRLRGPPFDLRDPPVADDDAGMRDGRPAPAIDQCGVAQDQVRRFGGHGERRKADADVGEEQMEPAGDGSGEGHGAGMVTSRAHLPRPSSPFRRIVMICTRVVSTLALCALLPAFAFAATPAKSSAKSGDPFDQSRYTALEWRNLGPARGGRVTAVTGVPGQRSVYYFGATGGGIWK